MKPTLLAIDVSYQTYRAAAAHPMLSHEGAFTGGLYGFLTTLAKQIRETQATRVVACFDVKPYRRSLIYPQYKLLRKKNADEELLLAFQESLPMVTEVLSLIGVPLMKYEGFESDDCIGALVVHHRSRYATIYAASNDSDLYQLLRCPTFKVIRKDINDVMTGEKLGVTPEEHMMASALTGTHNDIEGIPNVGPVTALKALRDPALMRKLRERWDEVIERNLKLIKLPHPEFPRIAPPAPSAGFYSRDLYKFCARYDIQVTKAMLDAFESASQ